MPVKRRRPITSPPGGKTSAWPNLAASGPANSSEVRNREHNSWGRRPSRIASARMTAVPSANATSAPRCAARASILRTSRMSGTLCRTTSSRVNIAAAIIGRAAFLLPLTTTRPSRRRPPIISRHFTLDTSNTMRYGKSHSTIAWQAQFENPETWSTSEYFISKHHCFLITYATL